MAIEQDAYSRLERRGNFFILTLLGDGEHRFNPMIAESILSRLRTLCSVSSPSTCTALITTNHGKFFSNGLDLAFGSREVVGKSFSDVLAAYMDLPMPTIAAVCGHAAAAGFIFALAHDYILMRRHRGFLYMSEIDVRVLIPPHIMRLIRSKLSPKAFRDVVLCGIKYTADTALSAGIVDSVQEDAESTLQEASKKAESLVSRGWNPEFYRQMRAAMYPFVKSSNAEDNSSTSALSKL
ncbi:hypothetical protein KP509_28G018900 [Ceratopteris richardii]|uniref:Delta(3)-Delta(2)-enoyl-CoA isomerase n=1 Tax=Ceratopteris richardii TaxID=49495 RepID=A0A8T2RBX2_CERRI|nr:hypothetical protein KP509_28G018900 [Ceratopteris richardii]KAH7293275.1 hypothetical protein KP509_28G018900 [Ceratopteris richardii]